MGEPHSALQPVRPPRSFTAEPFDGGRPGAPACHRAGGNHLIFVVLTLYSALFGIAIWFVIVGALRMMANRSPHASRLRAAFCATGITTCPRLRRGGV